MTAQKGQQWDVLDHGYIKLIDFMGTDETVIEAARMSTDKGFIGWGPYSMCDACGVVLHHDQPVPDTPCLCQNHKMVAKPNGDMGLLETLWSENHSTPFEMAELHLEVQAPIMVFREWHRHRTMSYNELSARYAKMPNIHYQPPIERIQKQSTANKQGSAEMVDPEYAEMVVSELQKEQTDVYFHYEQMLNEGVAKEVARINTPVSRYSRMRVKTDLLNWLRFLDRRMRPNAQHEIRMYADIIGEQIIGQLWPRSFKLFEEYTLHTTTFSRSETVVLKKILERVRQSGYASEIVLKEAYQSGMSESRFRKFTKKLGQGVEG